MKGYSYTTIAMVPGETPRVGVSIYPDENVSVAYYPAPTTSAPFIAIDFADSRVHLGVTSDTTVTDVHVQFARDLFNAAAAFLANCERLRDQNTANGADSSDKATPGKAA